MTVVHVANNAAKISRPRSSGTFPRQRLFDLIEQHRSQPALWISGPPGAGKTSLVTDYLGETDSKTVWYQIDEGDKDIPTFYYYLGEAVKKSTPKQRLQLPVLTPEFNQNISAFTRYYFRTLFARFSGKFIFVFDNYQETGEDTDFHELLALALEELPEDGFFIFISRIKPPPAYSRLQMHKQLALLEWDELKFTADEMQGICDLNGLSKDKASSVMSITQGWVAGLILLLAQKDEILFQSPDGAEFNPDLLFNYFVREIFDHASDETKRVLLKTAWFPKVTAEMAVLSSGIKAAPKILEALATQNFFTHRHSTGKNTIYEYHPLFRKFLLTEAEQLLGEVEFNVSKWNAAELLEHHQQLDAAVELFSELHDWDKVSELIKQTATNMIDQGRNVILQDWLSRIPEPKLNEDPWLLYWLAVATKDFSVQVSEVLLDKAFTQFTGMQDATGAYQTWSVMVECIRMDFLGDTKRLDLWFDRLQELRTDYPTFPSIDVEVQVATSMFVGLWWRQPYNEDLSYWYERASDAAEKLPARGNPKIWLNLIMVLHLIFSGDLVRASNLLTTTEKNLNSPSPHPYPAIMLHIANLLILWRWGEYELAHEHVKQALAIGERTGFPHENNSLYSLGASIALTQGNMALAKEYVDRHEVLDYGITGTRYHYCRAWYELLNNNLEVARVHAEESVRIARESGGMPFFLSLACIALAHVYFTLKNDEKGHVFLNEGQNIADVVGSGTLIYSAKCIEAKHMLSLGKDNVALQRIEEAFMIGREQNYVGISFFSHNDVLQLYTQALKAGIEVDYVKKVIKKVGLLPTENDSALEAWPWPVKIFCLSKAFEIHKDNKPIEFSRKSQKKPLALVKTLLAYGADKTPEYQVIEALWPDSDGDVGHQALATTLHRLRKLLGQEVVIFNDGYLSLNKQLVWADSWAFEQQVEQVIKTEEIETVEEMESLLSLYKGQFLEEDRDSYWSMQQREKLHHKYLQLVEMIGDIYEQKEQWQQASDCYLQGVQRDMLAERLYQRLMHCYVKMGRNADAVQTYRHFFRVINTRLGIEPSNDTKALLSKIQG